MEVAILLYDGVTALDAIGLLVLMKYSLEV